MKFSVWAPHAAKVEWVSQGRRVAMQSSEGGNWFVDIENHDDRHGYRYSLDGGTPLPDPRSRWQPEGVHGDSYTVHLVAERIPFQAKPLGDAVLYELHVGTFTSEGTYAAAQAKLPHLLALGITHIELLPLANFPGEHGWGYDGVDLFAPHAAYGTPAQLKEFVTTCHTHGVAVLLDVVYNHLGPDGNYLGEFAPYFTDRYKTGWGAAINYDGPDSDGVRRFIIDNALMWLEEYGFDGLRLDAVHAIYSFEAMHVLEALADAVRALGARLGCEYVLIAESDSNDPKLVYPTSRGGFGLDAHWCDDFHHAVHGYFSGESAGYYEDFHGLRDLATALREGYVYQGQYSRHRRRQHGRPPLQVKPQQLVVCSQNHDQVGNRAQGERLSMLVDSAKLKAIAAVTVLSPYVPMLFQGEEWGAKTPFLYFTDHQDKELGQLVAEGRAREFSAFQWAGEVPNPQELATFTRSKLDWSELKANEHQSLFEWYCALLRLRHECAGAASAGRARTPWVKFSESHEWLCFRHGALLVACTFANADQRVKLPPGQWLPRLCSTGVLPTPDQMQPGQSTVIYSQA